MFAESPASLPQLKKGRALTAGRHLATQGNLAASMAIDPGVFGVNVAVFGEVDVVGPLSLGANLDVLGLAAGPTRTIGSLEAKVQTVSYFLYGANDHGSLNSEFFAAVRVAPRVMVRAGLSHYETSYVVTDHGSSGSPSSRYQKFLSVPFVAVRLRL